MCEPLYFLKCEEYLDKAEEIYKNNSELPKDLYLKMRIKKAAFWKKYGFFDKALDYLKDLEASVKEVQESESDDKMKKSLLKLIFKINRD